MNATTAAGLPPRLRARLPSDWTLLLLHGTGGDEHDLVGLGRQLAPSAALLSPRGKVLEAGMPRFFRRLAVGQLDIPDLLVRTDELAAFVTAAAQAYGRDPGKIAALGFSNGANIAVSLLLRHPQLLSAAALLRPMLPYEPEGPAPTSTAPASSSPPARATRTRHPSRPGGWPRCWTPRGCGQRARRAGRRAQPRPRRPARTGAVGDGARRPRGVGLGLVG